VWAGVRTSPCVPLGDPSAARLAPLPQPCRGFASHAGDMFLDDDEFDTIVLSSDPGALTGDTGLDFADVGTGVPAAPAGGAGEPTASDASVSETVQRPQRDRTPFLSRKRMRQIRGIPRSLVRRLDDVGVFRATELQQRVGSATVLAVARSVFPLSPHVV